MSIEGDAQKDLSLDDEDTENVVGGLKRKKTTAKPQAHKSKPVQRAAAAGPNIHVTFAVPADQVSTSPPPDDCDPGESADPTAV